MTTGELRIEDYASVNAQAPSELMSKDYHFVPTTKILDTLQDAGWKPHTIQEGESKPVITRQGKEMINPRYGFQKHIVTLSNPDLPRITVNDDALFPEIVVTNSHDGSAQFQIMAGLYRMVCSNGLIVSAAQFVAQKIKHLGMKEEHILAAVEHVREATPRIAQRIGDFAIPLTREQQMEYAHASLLVKYGEGRIGDFDPAALIRPERIEDDKSTLWTTYNTVQEKLIEQGAEIVRTGAGEYDRKESRPIKSPAERVRVNRGLWDLAETMLEYVN